ncbi:restriction endonuclease subunit S [Mesorhizobium sp. B2-3-12]|uniref:restriction endonuclease subunit S n=1 Tax=Mesorhizobium sp. B2-3-12 TaxID=2589952 RepID=UPI00112EE801|nr:restriction endonuclease subunit S [Mesorhizobium sp. B2-3-12]TPL81891.1 type I restriction endonuclease subunit S [Mesorhizobium sp. B2-3-12]
MSELPDGWQEVPLSEVTDKIGSGATPKGGHAAYSSSGTPFIRSQNVHFSGFADVGLAYLDDMQARKLDGATVRSDDVLLNITGASIGRVTVAPERMDGARVNQHVAIIRTTEGIEPVFVAKFLASPPIQQFIVAENYGVTRQALTKAMIEEIELPVPPLPEQRRIVAKIESLAGKSRRARDHLDHIPRLVDKYKQAVLAAAFRGDLTSSDRVAQGWPDWTFERAADVCAKVQSGGTPKEGFETTGVPFLKVYNIVDQSVSFDYRPQFVTPSVHAGELRKSIALPGDVLMNIVGPPLGKVAIVPTTYPAWNLNQALTLFRPSARVGTKWLYHFLCSGLSVTEIANETKGSAGQVNISLSQCRNFMFPVPSSAEQEEIIRRIETALNWIDRLASDANSARKLIDRLDQSVLAKVFRGKLLPQDPTDEPASALLERIRAGRDTAAKVKQGRRG